MKVVFKIIKTGSGNDVYFERLRTALKEINIDSYIEYYPKYFQFFPWLLPLVSKKTDADIIHSNIEYGWAFKEIDKPLYVTLHHNVFDKKYRKYTSKLQRMYHDLILKPNIRKTLKFADKIISVSKYSKNSFLETFGEYPIDVIYNFIDIEKFTPLNVKSSDKRFKLLFVGNLTRRKGADLLPKIMKRLGKDYVLYYTTGLRTKIPKEFLLANMIPLGKLTEEELVQEYNKCDVFFFPSRFEGFGYAVAEAMSCGKPVITTNSSSLPELISNKINGFLCELNNIHDYVYKLKLLAENKTLKSKFGLNNRKKSVKNFSHKNLLINFLNIYESIN